MKETQEQIQEVTSQYAWGNPQHTPDLAPNCGNCNGSSCVPSCSSCAPEPSCSGEGGDN